MFNSKVNCYVAESSSVPIYNLDKHKFKIHLSTLSAFEKAWLETNGFKADVGNICLLPDEVGNLKSVYFGIGDQDDLWEYAILPDALPPNNYHFINETYLSCLAWGFASYKLKEKEHGPKLVIAHDKTHIINQMEAIYWVRNLINMPPNILTPLHLANEAMKLKAYGAKTRVITGKQLQKQFPLVYEVGKASSNEPCMIDIHWGNAKNPKIALIGKGVCFDSGGLDLKPPLAMQNMKKDMSGAAHILGLSKLIMQEKLPCNLHILIPAVDNVISGNALKPGDIITSGTGKTIEICNTDAEGRLILADAISEAVKDEPDYIIDFASLTAAAKIALGTEIPVVFSPQQDVYATLVKIGEEITDPVWGLPLHNPYSSMLKSQVADLKNAHNKPFGGAILAALFLQEFISENNWIHLDIMGWNVASSPGRPEGGEAMGLRTIYQFIKQKVLA